MTRTHDQGTSVVGVQLYRVFTPSPLNLQVIFAFIVMYGVTIKLVAHHIEMAEQVPKSTSFFPD